MNKKETFATIENIIAGYEDAISSHPPSISELYFEGLEPFLDVIAAEGVTAPRYIQLVTVHGVAIVQNLLYNVSRLDYSTACCVSYGSS